MGLSQKPQPKPNLFPLAPNTFKDAICVPDSEDQPAKTAISGIETYGNHGGRGTLSHTCTHTRVHTADTNARRDPRNYAAGFRFGVRTW